MLTDPRLLIGQCCGYDVVYGFSSSVTPLATPEFDADGCEGSDYRSFVLVRNDSPAGELADLRGATCVINGFNSHSGTNALRALVAPLSRDGRFFGAVKVSGAHVESLALLKAGEAEIMAMDCVVHALLRRYRPDALDGTRILCRTGSAPAPPLVTSTAQMSAESEIADGPARRFHRSGRSEPMAAAAAPRGRVSAADRLFKDRRDRGRRAGPRLS